MRNFIRHYKNPNEDLINKKLISREYDDNLVSYIVDACKSLEVLSYIEFLGYEYIENEADINTSEYINARMRGNKKKNDPTKYMYMHDSRCGELRLKFKLDCNGDCEIITKNILIPIIDRNMYYTIKGNKYLLMYQIVDNSTYTTKKSLVLKSMMPVAIRVKSYTAKSTDDVSYTAPIYTINVFKKDVDIMLFYLAKIGIKNTLSYFSLDPIVNFVSGSYDPEDKENLYFAINTKLYLQVNKYFFQKYNIVKTLVFMLLSPMTNRLTPENLLNKNYWIDTLGSVGTTNKNNQFEKGLNTLTFFDRMIDNTTKKILKVHPINKKNTYSILRWMILNFNDLRKKDNLSLDNKRLRCNEYIASLLTKTFSERINRVIAMGSKASIKNVKDIFKFPGDIIIGELHKSGLLRYDARVNDMDFFGKTKITTKGPNSLGGNNENNIAIKYRGIDPSFIGRLDINVCGTSDPGTTAELVPFCETHGLYFSDEYEPESMQYILEKDIIANLKCDETAYNITPVMDDADGYYDALNTFIENSKGIHVDDISDDSDAYVIDITIDDDI